MRHPPRLPALAALLQAVATAAAAAPCPPPPPAACPVVAYAAPDFAGPAACVPATGPQDAAALAALGLPGGALRSLEVAPGYLARLPAAGRADDRDADTVLGGRVARLYGRGAAGDGAVDHLAVRPRRACGPRPRVFMALHGSAALVPARHDGAWAEVRAHLDGIWGNDAHVSPPQAAAIYRKVATRTLIQEEDHNDDDAHWIPVGVYAGLQRQNPDIVLRREALALHRASPRMWRPDDVGSLRHAYVSAPQVAPRYLFERIYTGWQAPWWAAPADGGAPLPAGAADAFAAADGAFLECDAAACTGAARRALRRIAAATHARGGRLVWYNSTAGAADAGAFMAATQSVFNDLGDDGVLGPDDVVMIINDYGRLPTLPERDAGGEPAATVTGTLLWLLLQ